MKNITATEIKRREKEWKRRWQKAESEILQPAIDNILRIMNMPETVDSTSDARVVNNVMRHEYRVLTDLEKELMSAIKDSGLAFYSQIEAIEKVTSPSRELSLAKTKIEEAVMWSVKHLTK